MARLREQIRALKNENGGWVAQPAHQNQDWPERVGLDRSSQESLRSKRLMKNFLMLRFESLSFVNGLVDREIFPLDS